MNIISQTLSRLKAACCRHLRPHADVGSACGSSTHHLDPSDARQAPYSVNFVALEKHNLERRKAYCRDLVDVWLLHCRDTDEMQIVLSGLEKQIDGFLSLVERPGLNAARYAIYSHHWFNGARGKRPVLDAQGGVRS